MKKQPIFEFYWFGTCLRYLQDASTSHAVHGDDHVLGNIEAFFGYLENLGLIVTHRVAKQQLSDIRKELESVNEGDSLTPDQADRIGSAMEKIRVTLDAELQGVHAYTPTSKRLNLSSLLENPKALFSPGVFDHLPPLAQRDFANAGRCIAFEISTASAFHLMRGTEAVLRFYYNEMVRQNRVSSRNWGPIIADLRKRARTRKYDTLNNHLDNIRVSFRNPTQHPDAEYDIHEVQDLYSICIEVVNRIVKTLRKEGKV